MAEQFSQNLKKLGVDEETIDAINREIRQQMSAIRGQSQDPDADRDAVRQQRSSIRDRVLSKHLNSDQQRELAMLLTAAGRRAGIWIRGEDGQPQARAIRIGISDDRFTCGLGEFQSEPGGRCGPRVWALGPKHRARSEATGRLARGL